jgi:hypothetical protein
VKCALRVGEPCNANPTWREPAGAKPPGAVGYCPDFWSRGARGSTVMVKSHCRHFQVSSSGMDGCDLLRSMVILQRGQIFRMGASTTIKL